MTMILLNNPATGGTPTQLRITLLAPYWLCRIKSLCMLGASSEPFPPRQIQAKAKLERQTVRISDDLLEGERPVNICECGLRSFKNPEVFRLIDGRWVPFRLGTERQARSVVMLFLPYSSTANPSSQCCARNVYAICIDCKIELEHVSWIRLGKNTFNSQLSKCF